jgi:hypothetical protein
MAQQAAKKLTPKNFALPAPGKKSVRKSKRTYPGNPNVYAATQHIRQLERKKVKPSAKPVGVVFTLINSCKELGGISPWTMRSWMRKGLVNYFRVGPAGHVFIAATEIDRLLNEGAVRATAI